MPTQAIYRCFCGTQVHNLPTNDVCHRCGSGLIAAHVGSAPSAQPHAAAVAEANRLAAAPTLAAPTVPKGNPNNTRVVRTGMLSNGKSSIVTIDIVSGFPVNDTRQS